MGERDARERLRAILSAYDAHYNNFAEESDARRT